MGTRQDAGESAVHLMRSRTEEHEKLLPFCTLPDRREVILWLPVGLYHITRELDHLTTRTVGFDSDSLDRTR